MIWQKIVAVCFVIKGLRAEEEEEEEEARGNEMDAVVKAVIEAIHASPTHAVLYLSGGGSQVTTSHTPRSLWNLQNPTSNNSATMIFVFLLLTDPWSLEDVEEFALHFA